MTITTGFSPPFARGLAIETSGKYGSVALVENSAVVIEESFPHGLKHAAGMLPLIDRLLRERNWKPADLHHLYVSQGPGSFTGLRIGITLAKTLALATGARIAAVPTLRVLAMNAPAEASHVIIVLDAKRGEIFTARYQRIHTEWIEREPAQVDTLVAMLARSPRPVHLIGEGIPYHSGFLPADTTGITVTDELSWRPSASIVAQLGIELACQDQFIAADQFTPLYVRRPEAEEKYL